MGGWVDGWVGGRESRVKDCLQQSKIKQIKTKSAISAQSLKLVLTCLFYYKIAF
jgi:hypothetical protein